MNYLKTTVKYGLKSLGFGVKGLAVYGALLMGTQIVSNFASQNITSQAQLEQLLQTEKKRISCNKNILARLVDEDETVAGKIRDGSYRIILGGFFANLSSLRHETYHICDGHTEYEPTLLRYFFWGEPKATIYQATGLRL